MKNSIVVTQYCIDSEMFLHGPRYAIKIKNTLGTALDGLYVIEDTDDGPGIKLYETFEEAAEVALGFNDNAVEIIEYVYSHE